MIEGWANVSTALQHAFEFRNEAPRNATSVESYEQKTSVNWLVPVVNLGNLPKASAEAVLGLSGLSSVREGSINRTLGTLNFFNLVTSLNILGIFSFFTCLVC